MTIGRIIRGTVTAIILEALVITFVCGLLGIWG